MTPGSLLFFQYSASNSVGESDLSNEVSYALAEYPAAPTGLKKVDALSTIDSIYLQWEIVADYEVNVIGYQVWMESGHNGLFTMVYDGKNFPGVNHYSVTGLSVGDSYRFKVASLNENGAGPFTEEVEYFSCLPPGDILPPVFVSSTETTMTLDWTFPLNLNGCPLETFQLYMDDGADGSIDTLVGEFEPQISSTTIDSFTSADTSKFYRFQLVGITAGGSIISGIAQFKLAAIPGKPDAPVNIPALTNDT